MKEKHIYPADSHNAIPFRAQTQTYTSEQVFDIQVLFHHVVHDFVTTIGGFCRCAAGKGYSHTSSS
jgi:hypothetical protein